MLHSTPVTEDKDLEHLFAAARQYPLLDADQERTADSEKWQAVADMQLLLLKEADALSFLGNWADNCLHNPPQVELFTTRELYFLLRRDLSSYLPAKESADALGDFNHLLKKEAALPECQTSLDKLGLPASLVAGMVELQLSRHTDASPPGIAQALREWSRHWPSGSRYSSDPVSKVVRKRFAKSLQQYFAARDKLMLHNLRLVYSIAGRYRNRGMSFLDIVQEGMLGLLRAAEKFDHAKGYRFSTYCYNWITQAIRRALSDSRGIIRFPLPINEQLGKLHGQRAALQANTATAPSDTELASGLGLSVDKTRSLLQLHNLGISLETPQFEEGDSSTLADKIAGGPFGSPAAAAEQDSLKRCLLSAIESLSQAEQQVVINRWGLHQGPALSRAEIADKMALSRERIRQLESSALKKLGRDAMVCSVHDDHYELSA